MRVSLDVRGVRGSRENAGRGVLAGCQADPVRRANRAVPVRPEVRARRDLKVRLAPLAAMVRRATPASRYKDPKGTPELRAPKGIRVLRDHRDHKGRHLI